MKYFDENIKNILQWQDYAIQSFDYLSSRISNGYKKILNPNAYLNKSLFTNDDSTYETLETISNFHLVLIKDFLSHRLMRLLRMTSSLTESD